MDEVKYSSDADLRYLVPRSFPRPPYPPTTTDCSHGAALNGNTYEQRLSVYSPCELFTRWDACEDLAFRLAEHSRLVVDPTARRELQDQYVSYLLDFGWISSAEIKWIVTRAAWLSRL